MSLDGISVPLDRAAASLCRTIARCTRRGFLAQVASGAFGLFGILTFGAEKGISGCSGGGCCRFPFECCFDFKSFELCKDNMSQERCQAFCPECSELHFGPAMIGECSVLVIQQDCCTDNDDPCTCCQCDTFVYECGCPSHSVSPCNCASW
jgi:hypothetical protein